MDVPRQRGKKVQPGQVLLPVENGLIQMGHAPPLGNVEAQERGQLLGRRTGDGVAPGAEGHQQVPRPVKGQVAVHHGGDADAAHGGQRQAEFALHIGGQRRIGGLQPVENFLLRIGPDPVIQLVLPGKIPLGQRGEIRPDEHRLDAGGAKFQPEGAFFKFRRG